MALNLLNDEASLHGILYQDPMEIYPFTIFYGSDNRDNLEENLGFPSAYDAFIKKKEDEGKDKFFLSGDEM